MFHGVPDEVLEQALESTGAGEDGRVAVDLERRLARLDVLPRCRRERRDRLGRRRVDLANLEAAFAEFTVDGS